MKFRWVTFSLSFAFLLSPVWSSATAFQEKRIGVKSIAFGEGLTVETTLTNEGDANIEDVLPNTRSRTTSSGRQKPVEDVPPVGDGQGSPRPDPRRPDPRRPTPDLPTGAMGEVYKIITLGQAVVAFGESVYKLVEKSKPMTKMDYAPISLLPRKVQKDFVMEDMEGWSMPQMKEYTVTFKNRLGYQVGKFVYRLFYIYGGNYNSSGKFLTGIIARPKEVRVASGYNLDVTMQLDSAVNYGKVDNIIASAQVSMSYSLSSIMSFRSYGDTFMISGDGYFKKF